MLKKPYPALLIIIVLIITGSMACGSHPTPLQETNAIRQYADPATDTTLVGLSEHNLDKYTQYGNPSFKKAVTQKLFDQVAGKIESQFGTYQSKKFLRAEQAQGYIVVHYRAYYTDGEIGVRMAFDQNQLIAGHYFE